jgi:hypothetical protein
MKNNFPTIGEIILQYTTALSPEKLAEYFAEKNPN